VSVVQVVAAPDGHYGEVAAAFVELRPGAALTEEDVIGHCLEQLATFKVPRYVRFVTEWPMSGTRSRRAGSGSGSRTSWPRRPSPRPRACRARPLRLRAREPPSRHV